ncbi:hypothetical protein BaRGS_00012263, partial [Batillaria attramentaria]
RHPVVREISQAKPAEYVGLLEPRASYLPTAVVTQSPCRGGETVTRCRSSRYTYLCKDRSRVSVCTQKESNSVQNGSGTCTFVIATLLTMVVLWRMLRPLSDHHVNLKITRLSSSLVGDYPVSEIRQPRHPIAPSRLSMFLCFRLTPPTAIPVMVHPSSVIGVVVKSTPQSSQGRAQESGNGSVGGMSSQTENGSTAAFSWLARPQRIWEPFSLCWLAASTHYGPWGRTPCSCGECNTIPITRPPESPSGLSAQVL